MKILIKNCNLISMSSKREKYEENVDILINDDTIEKIDKNINKENCDRIIDANGKVVMPGLINTHTHIPMSIFRDTLDGYGLQEWLNDKIWPMEDKLKEEDIYYASLLSCIEMIKSGTTCFNDQYFMTENIIKASTEIGLRIHCTRPLMDVDGNGEERLKGLEELINKYKEYNNNVTINVGVHSLYTCTKEHVEKAVKLAKKYNLYIHMHFAENSQEIEDIKRLHNTSSPIKLLPEYFKDCRMLLAHCVKVKPEEMDILKELDVSISHCPVSNLKLGCGRANIKELEDKGINVTLGTDGQGSGNNLDMFSAMSFAALLQKGINENPKLFPAYDVIKMATINGAKALNMEDKIGSIDEGKLADIIIIDLKTAKTEPINDIFSNIVYNSGPENVVTTIVNGKVIMDNKTICGIDEASIYSACKAIIDRIA